uniref:Chemosensory protein 8 n=1 Tax=Riptortus pedestris TaxID=329032 RepID=A0A2Z4HQ00_RIPPE|nr:chemosensory protein 8 [Riptortus pedestris]
MKLVLALGLVVAAVSALPQAQQGSYTTKYDSVNLDEVLSNERLYKNYFNCLANKGKCTPDAAELKKVLPDALETGCAKCNEKQKKGTEKVIKHMLDKRPADYDVLEKIYDPKGEFRKKYKDEAGKHGIKL